MRPNSEMEQSNLKFFITLCLILTLSTSACAFSIDFTEPKTTVVILCLVCFSLLVFSYGMYVENSHLKEEIVRLKSKFIEYVKEKEGKYEPVRTVKYAESPLEPPEEKLTLQEQHARRLYWDRLASTITKSSASGGELAELEAKKKDLQDMIELTKTKYHQREIDEKSFSDIIKDQQKQLIEIESKINKLKSKD